MQEVITLDPLINLVRTTSGRRILALRKVRNRAAEMGFADLVARIDAAIAHDRHTRTLDNQWSSSRGQPTYGPDVPDIDNWVDQLLTAIRDDALAYTRSSWDGTDQQNHAERFLEQAFPNGVQAITSQPYVDQVASVESLLDTMDNKLGTEIAALALLQKVERLRTLTVAYREAVDKDRNTLEFATVQAARKRGHAGLLGVTVMILSTFHDDARPEHLDARSRLLEPILAQDGIVRAILSARRAVPDIDPDQPLDAGTEQPGDAGIDGQSGDAAVSDASQPISEPAPDAPTPQPE